MAPLRRLAFAAAISAVLVSPVAGQSLAGAAPAPGDRLWTRMYAASAAADTWTAVAARPDGTIYVAGTAAQDPLVPSYTKLVVARYTAGGARLWKRTYDGPEHLGAAPVAIAVDPFGRLVVAGTANRPDDESDIVVRQYRANGSLRWTRRYDGIAKGVDYATDMTLDESGAVYVAGSSESIGVGPNMIVLKYSTQGLRQWEAMYAGPGMIPSHWADTPTGLVVNRSHAVYVCGFSDDGDGLVSAVVVKLKANGNRAWDERRHYSVADDSFDDIALAPNGDVVVTGHTVGGMSTVENLIVARFTPAGRERWPAATLDIGGAQDWGELVRLDKSGNAYVTGISMDRDPMTGSSHAVLAKCSSSGTFRWHEVLTLADPTAPTRYVALRLDGSGNAYCGGSTVSASADFYVSKYSPAGVLQWSDTYNPGSPADYYCTALVVSGKAVYGVGGGGLQADMLIVKYRR